SATDVVQAPNLTITKTGNGTVNSTDTVSFTITVSNTGAGTEYTVDLSAALPGGLAWTTDAGTISGGTLSDAIGDLASGASVTIHVNAPTAAGYNATLDNTATATSLYLHHALPISSATDVVQAPNLTITKTGNGTVNSTDTVRFTITVSNTGAGSAYNVNVSDALPGGLAWTTDAGTISGGSLSDAIGDLASGASVTIHVSAPTAAGYSVTLNNTATATSSNPTPRTSNPSATDVVQAPNLTITKTGNGTVNSTDTVSFTITVSNTG